MLNFRVNYFLYRSKKRKDGLAPIYLRIIKLNSSEKISFTTRLYVKPKQWDSKSKRIGGRSERTILINQNLNRIRSEIESFILSNSLIDSDFNIRAFNVFRNGKAKETNTSLGFVIDEYIAYIQKLIGKDYTKTTLNRYKSFKTILVEVLGADRVNSTDIEKVDIKFVNELELLYKTEKNYKPYTVHRTLKYLNTILNYAIKKEYIDKNPFLHYRQPKIHKNIVFLTRYELDKVENLKLKNEGIERVRLMFLFSCYSGLGYLEAKNLIQEDIYTDNQNQDWIRVKRQKTQKEYIVPLLPKAKQYLKKIDYNGVKVLPMISNQKFNQHLKTIASEINLEKNLSHHIARKTFATTVLLNNGVPLDAVSKMLGHSSTKLTEDYYAKFEVNRLQKIVADL